MKKPIKVLFEPEGRSVEAEIGASILEAASSAGIGIRSDCGGKGLCGKCRVIVQDQSSVSQLTEAETKFFSPKELGSGYRLACCALLKHDTKVMIPDESRVLARKIQLWGFEKPIEVKPNIRKFYLKLAKPTLLDIRTDLERILDLLKREHGLEDLKIGYETLKKMPDTLRNANWQVTVTLLGDREIIAFDEGDTSNQIFGLAVDIGTSKIVGSLVDLTTGKTLSTGFIENPQMLYGEDIISRITSSANDEEKLRSLHKLLVEGVNKVLDYTCTQAGVNPQKVYEVTVVGNTAMHHFFLGINPKHVAISPFTPALKSSINVKAKEMSIKICPEGVVHVLPIIAGFVGADAVADVLASGIYESKELSLLLDVGTNTEVFVGNSEDLLSCSCASGPAFEGIHIKHGMKAVTGAIEKLSISQDFEVKYKTIDDAAPRGICGSAMIDVVAEMFKRGIINNRGRFNTSIKTPRLKKVNGDLEFVLAWKDESGIDQDITVTQKDITQIQLAKAAIFAGCWILVKRKGVKMDDVSQLLIAGSFGSYINPENAKTIGLVPDIPTEKIKFVGNTALTGAKMALISVEARRIAEVISKKTRYLELATDPAFQQEFADAMFIPHKDVSRFPSAKSIIETNARKN
ncbi:MAG: ASKHA domain-containing protein [Candidatus Bathyarchaeia archaeon]